jgi:uncharacterized protein with PQ loop repeat
MTPAACALLAFTSLNIARVAAYAPQIVRIYRDKNGASAVSIVTWTLFALTHLATIAYALLTAGDLIMASIFSLNATCCIAVIVLTTWKRIRHRQLQNFSAPDTAAPFGTWCGISIFRRLTDVQFSRWVNLLLVVSGIGLLS